MPSNRDIRRMLTLYAELLQLHEQQLELSRYLASAAYYTRRLKGDIISLDQAELDQTFRPPIAKIIRELKETGTIANLDELIQLTPAGLFELMQLKGLGGKKLAIIWKIAKIDSIEDLLKACERHEIRKLPGFGEKTEQNIRNAIESHKLDQDRFHYASIASAANNIIMQLKQLMSSAHWSLCGSIRRCSVTVPGIEIVTSLSSQKLSAEKLKKIMIVKSSDLEKTVGITLDEIPITIYHSSPSRFYFDLFHLTGNEAHVKKIEASIRKKSFQSEKEIYEEAGFPFIVPEMRENIAEWNFGNKTGELITVEDIKGVVHNHTTYSDGVDKLESFANACKRKGFEYTVISDHSKNAHYAGGLKEEKVLQQFKEIDELNKKLTPFHIFKSIECDIKVNGDLDYSNDFLELFDLVIVSVHQLLKMDEEKATRRLIKAIENPNTTILGHMTGRLLLIRSGYPVNYKKIIDACAANEVVIEVNANPYRLDMDWAQIPYALQKGVWISIDPDAHSIREIENIQWGVAAARKGGLTKDRTWNALSLKKIREYLKRKNSRLNKAVK
jgi:DNA polymerase (family X)